nr:MAG TPA: hypothetical protein [Caudoviricetes sp.]
MVIKHRIMLLQISAEMQDYIWEKLLVLQSMMTLGWM